MASTTPLVDLDDQNKDENQVEGFHAATLKRNRTNTPWTPAEEDRLKGMRDAGDSWEEIAKTFPSRSEGAIKKHWYKDMHYADFAEDDSAALIAAIDEYEASRRTVIAQKVGKSAKSEDFLAAMAEYEASKWKVIGQKLGKPAKACEKYAREHFARRDASDRQSPFTKKKSSMSFRDSDEPSTEKKAVREGDETPADASDYPKRQKPSKFDHPKHPKSSESSKKATSLSPDLEHRHSSHKEVPTMSGKSAPVVPTGLGSLPLTPPSMEDTKSEVEVDTKREVEVDRTLRENEDGLSDDSMGLIATKVRREIPRQGTIKATLVIGWDPVEFMKTQYPSDVNARLGSVITLSGWALRAQATTCSDYAQKTWPTQGLFVIGAFESAISYHSHKIKESVVGLKVDLELDVDLGQVCTLVVQSNSPTAIVEVFQQAIWMGAALRVSNYQRIQYSTFDLEYDYAHSFVVKFKELALPEWEQSCWLSLFRNPLIARGFPVPQRQNGEQGLEIPLQMMSALGGARHVTEFQGGLVLKGHSTMFVPFERHRETIQWHFIERPDNQRILYQELNTGHSRAPVEEVDYEALWKTRAFLGWWKSAEIHLGTAETAYKNIDWSSARGARRTPKLSGANVGFQTMITGQLNFIMGAKDGRFHFSQKGPFQRIIQCAENTPVVLYDIDDHRAWLVPALNVMLHIVQTRHHLSPYKLYGNDIALAPVIPKNGKCAATDAVTSNQWRQLYDHDIITKTRYLYKDAILDLWSQIERLMEKEDSLESGTGLAMHGTMRSEIYGWEYMSLVHEKNYQRKEAAIAKTSGGWVDLINDIDALVLFATGLGDIIKPVADLSSLCPLWRSLPKGKDYLAACVPTMELLYSEAGSRSTHEHLSTSHLQWHRGSTLFEQCRGTSSGRCECDRTQQIYHDSLFRTFGHVRPPGNLEENGCVVFGLSRHPFKPTKAVAMRQNAVHILPNTSIQNGGTTPRTHEKDDGLIAPVPPASVSPEPEDLDNHPTRNSKRPLSPLNTSEGLVQELAVSSKRKRRTSDSQTSNFDLFKGPKDRDVELSQSDDCVTRPLELQWKTRHNDYCNKQQSRYTETVYDSEAEIAPVDVGRTLRHKPRIRGR